MVKYIGAYMYGRSNIYWIRLFLFIIKRILGTIRWHHEESTRWSTFACMFVRWNLLTNCLPVSPSLLLPSLSLSLCLSVCLSVSLCLSLCPCLSLSLSLCLSVCLSFPPLTPSLCINTHNVHTWYISICLYMYMCTCTYQVYNRERMVCVERVSSSKCIILQ